MKTEPMIRAMNKAYKASLTCKLDSLLREESRWKRKVTIAENKLADVRKRINGFAIDAAMELDGPGQGKEQKP